MDKSSWGLRLPGTKNTRNEENIPSTQATGDFCCCFFKFLLQKLKSPQGVRIALNWQLNMKEPKCTGRNQQYLSFQCNVSENSNMGLLFHVGKMSAHVCTACDFLHSQYQTVPRFDLPPELHSLLCLICPCLFTQRAATARAWSHSNEYCFLRNGGFWVWKRKCT